MKLYEAFGTWNVKSCWFDSSFFSIEKYGFYLKIQNSKSWNTKKTKNVLSVQYLILKEKKNCNKTIYYELWIIYYVLHNNFGVFYLDISTEYKIEKLFEFFFE